MPFPLAAMLILQALGMGTQQALSQRNTNKQLNRQNALSQDQLGLQESELNPFRGANFQRSAVEGLDRQQNTTPRTITQSGGPGGYGEIQGGQYSMSPEVMQWLAQLKARIQTGQAANPAITPSYRANQPNLGTASANTDVLADGSYYDPTLKMWMPPRGKA